MHPSYDKRYPNQYHIIGKSDYVRINNDGNLEHWDKEGYLMTSKIFNENFIAPRNNKISKDFDVLSLIGQNIFDFRYKYDLDDFETLNGTNNTIWITYYPEVDITIHSNKKNDNIISANFGKNPK